eukprot:gnl/Spiro4/18848_TR10073_c0_g1_i1.p1 gnl/Spiro4/18848_TR10073_c0_g1~~gnl/Spiro4/18848_TR10073_c0_g1_i1.p1  ORF type:complete len:204 (-),score=45.21 gnl/Spiro4/18848_TR10073_c0_g1_i1:86-697(-)
MGGGLAIQNDTDRTIYVELYHVPDWVYHACTVEPYSKADIRCGRVWFTVAVHDAAIKNAKEDRSAEFEGLFGEIDDLSSVEHAVAISHVKNAPPGVCRGSTRNAVYANARTLHVIKRRFLFCEELELTFNPPPSSSSSSSPFPATATTTTVSPPPSGSLPNGGRQAQSTVAPAPPPQPPPPPQQQQQQQTPPPPPFLQGTPPC